MVGPESNSRDFKLGQVKRVNNWSKSDTVWPVITIDRIQRDSKVTAGGNTPGGLWVVIIALKRARDLHSCRIVKRSMYDIEKPPDMVSSLR